MDEGRREEGKRGGERSRSKGMRERVNLANILYIRIRRLDGTRVEGRRVSRKRGGERRRERVNLANTLYIRMRRVDGTRVEGRRVSGKRGEERRSEGGRRRTGRRRGKSPGIDLTGNLGKCHCRIFLEYLAHSSSH